MYQFGFQRCRTALREDSFVTCATRAPTCQRTSSACRVLRRSLLAAGGGKIPRSGFLPRSTRRLSGKTRLTRDRAPGASALAQFSYFRGTDELPRPSEPFAFAFCSPARCSERRD